MGNDLRRRMMQQAAGSTGPLVYSIYNRNVSDSEVIETGIKPLADGFNLTILLDITVTNNPTDTSKAYRYCLISAGWSGNGITVLKPSQWNNGLRTRFLASTDNDDVAKILSSSAGRKRVVITRAAGADSIKAIGKDGDSAQTEKTLEKGQNGSIDKTSELSLGYAGLTGAGLPTGTITKFEVYNIILSDSDIAAFLA